MHDLHLITPELPADTILTRARAALEGVPAGRVALQLRARHLPVEELHALAQALRALTRAAGVALLINADLELARAVGADGVQLPERGPTPEQARARLPAAALLGASRHDLAGVKAAAQAGASFVTLSPVFGVPGKGGPLGVAGFAAIASASELDVIALGGIDVDHVPELIAAGARGVAVIRAVWDSADPALACLRLLAAVTAGRAANAG